MFLQVTFEDGTTLDVGLSNSHTVQVLSPANAIENSFAVSGVKQVQLVEGDPPVPAAAEHAAVVPPADAASTDAPADAAPVEAAPADPPVAAPSSDEQSEPQNTSSDSTTDDPAHEDAVAQVQDSLTVVSEATPNDRGELLAVLQSDIESALGQWPDSQPLLDAKKQLDTLAAEA